MSDLIRKETRREAGDMGWAVVGDKGAIEFWFTEHKGCTMPLFGEKIGGVETHYASPPDYYASEPPHHEHCYVLDAPCWHDGSSLWALEYWIPHYEQLGEEWVWSRLELAYREVFTPKDD